MSKTSKKRDVQGVNAMRKENTSRAQWMRKRIGPNRRKAKIKRGNDTRGQAQHIHEGNKTHLQHENENPQLASGENRSMKQLDHPKTTDGGTRSVDHFSPNRGSKTQITFVRQGADRLDARATNELQIMCKNKHTSRQRQSERKAPQTEKSHVAQRKYPRCARRGKGHRKEKREQAIQLVKQ